MDVIQLKTKINYQSYLSDYTFLSFLFLYILRIQELRGFHTNSFIFLIIIKIFIFP